jgi:hypothetical protein
LAAAVCLPGFLALATPSQAQTAPTIKKVKIVTRGNGTFKAKIIGANFGASPVTLPCVDCAIPELDVFPYNVGQIKVTIRSWTDQEILVSDIKGAAGTTYFFAVKNDSLGTTAAASANLPGGPAPPVIKHVSFKGSGANLKIFVTGSGFGSTPPGVPGDNDIPYFGLLIYMPGYAPNSDHYPWYAGHPGNAVTLKYKSWSDTRIEVDGFGSYYGQNNFFVNSGDAAGVIVFNVLPNGGGIGASVGTGAVIP